MSESFHEANKFKRAIYTLHEASVSLGIPVDDVMQFAAQGVLRVFARIPMGFTLFSTDRQLAAIESDTVLTAIQKRNRFNLDGVTAVHEPEIEMIEVSRNSCNAIAVQGEAYQQVFYRGVRLHANGNPTVVEPSPLQITTTVFGIDYLDHPFSRLFACYSVSLDPNAPSLKGRLQPSTLNLTLDMVRVLASDLAAVIPHPPEIDDPEFDIGFRPEAHMPLSLIKLHEAAMAHWDFRQRDWKKPEPKNVVASLLKVMDEHGKPVFSGNMAQAAEFILRTTFEYWRQADHKKRVRDGIATPFEALVVVSSAWSSRMDEKYDKFAAPMKYRNKEEAIEFFKECRIADSYLVSAWTIAAPLSARRSRRMKQ